MCARFYMELSPELRPYVELAKRSPLLNAMVGALGRALKTEGEIRPTDLVPVVAPARKNREPAVFPMVWGFTNPRSGAPLINARSETAASRPFWKNAWAARRCMIPASYYFEWEHCSGPDGRKKTGSKYMIQPKNSPVLYLAGLYGLEERNGLRVPVFTVLTREPCEEIRFIHDRMPVMLPKELVRAWLSPGERPEEVLKNAVTDVYFEAVP